MRFIFIHIYVKNIFQNIFYSPVSFCVYLYLSFFLKESRMQLSISWKLTKMSNVGILEKFMKLCALG